MGTEQGSWGIAIRSHQEEAQIFQLNEEGVHTSKVIFLDVDDDFILRIGETAVIWYDYDSVEGLTLDPLYELSFDGVASLDDLIDTEERRRDFCKEMFQSFLNSHETH